GGAPGDVVDVKITGKDKKFLIGTPIHFHTSSPERVTPFCEHFGTCGGCKWQHISYEAQLHHKQEHVAENLRKLSGIDLPEMAPIMGSEKTVHYRNKLEYTFSNKRWMTREEISSERVLSRNALGFHIPRMFDKILDIQECHLQAAPSNAIRLAFKRYAEENELRFFDIREQHGFLRNLIIRTTSIGETMVIVQFAEPDREQIFKVMNFLKEEFPEITSLLYVVNEKKNETFYDLPVKNFHGEDYIREKMGGLTFRIGPKSFYQTNSLQAYELYKRVLEMAGLTGEEIVYDLYTGTGTIANFVAHQAKKVVGIESVEDAVEDARKNSAVNGITNTEFFAGDMKDMLSNDFIRAHGKPRVVITDPPRAGMHHNVIKSLNRILPQRIVYVSCNPATQARDLELLAENYVVEQIQPVDMFPHTHHVENILLLKLHKH
ncbi:MAG: 23S rRNA (uracil(1939)-C(5))-methyltransferase RlmD, partial [Cyclobacteriaceae bacterium]|nr:23S rRNA (uracil(1939)-C(5))-methyltransferase RlmD [Cyclobacteriaceae bacterium]